MIFMAIVECPVSKAKEYIENAAKLGRIPSYIKKWQILTNSPGNGIYKQYHIIYTAKDNTDDALIHITSRFNAMDQIEGFSWKLEPCLSALDALKAGKIPEKIMKEALQQD